MCEKCKKKVNVLAHDEDLDRPLDVEKNFKSAVKFVMSKGIASSSSLVVALEIGYQRAWTFIKRMESMGYIEVTKERFKKVLITPEQFRKDFGEE